MFKYFLDFGCLVYFEIRWKKIEKSFFFDFDGNSFYALFYGAKTWSKIGKTSQFDLG